MFPVAPIIVVARPASSRICAPLFMLPAPFSRPLVRLFVQTPGLPPARTRFIIILMIVSTMVIVNTKHNGNPTDHANKHERS